MIYLVHGVKVQFEVVQFQFRLVQCHQVVLVVELVQVKLLPSMALVVEEEKTLESILDLAGIAQSP